MLHNDSTTAAFTVSESQWSVKERSSFTTSGCSVASFAQSGVAGPHVVQSDPRAARPKTEQGPQQRLALAGVDVLGELDDHITERCGFVERLLQRRRVQQVGAHVHREKDSVRHDGAAGERGPQRQRLQLGPLTGGVCDGEPLVRRCR